MTRGFVEVGTHQISKGGQRMAGDTALTRRSRDGRRTITVLSDGLGSGVKAGVLSTLTATMALRLVEHDLPIDRVARVIMETLPVCSTRHISYSTFTIVDINSDGRTRVIEYDNPRFLFVRDGHVCNPQRRRLEVDRPEGSVGTLYYSELEARLGDRIVLVSDGVTQSGMGSPAYPLGWGDAGLEALVRAVVAHDPALSAARLASRLVVEASRRDGVAARDDISASVLYFRRPRRLLVVTGPPLDPTNDSSLAKRVREFDGSTVVAGGTTGNIIARELGVQPKVELRNLDPAIPPHATMDGVDLVTEGIVTMARVADLLEHPAGRDGARENAATMFTDHMLESDSIEFVVGTRVNQAHQDPRVPAQFELRRTITDRIARLLGERYLKEVKVSYT